jgi:hypothetical protein
VQKVGSDRSIWAPAFSKQDLDCFSSHLKTDYTAEYAQDTLVAAGTGSCQRRPLCG